MYYGVTNDELFRDGVNLIAENHNLKKQLEDCKRLLKAYEAAWLAEDRAKAEEAARKAAEEDERKARELEEAIRHKEHYMYDRDYTKGYLAKIYGRQQPRPGKRHEWRYHD